jgi:hypothetical protein
VFLTKTAKCSWDRRHLNAIDNAVGPPDNGRLLVKARLVPYLLWAAGQ